MRITRSVQGCGLFVSLLVSGLSANWVHAQNYPAKPIRIHTAAPGGGPDYVARVVASELNASLGQAVVVENHPAPQIPIIVSKAAPDGYSLMVVGASTWVQPLLESPPPPYDVMRDFAPITILTTAPFLLVVTPSLPVKTVADLVKLAKAKPGQLNFSTALNGSGSHIAGELFKSLAGIDIVRVAYKGGSQESADLQSGQVHMTFGSGAGVGPQVRSGKLRALASAGTRRSALFPDLSTVAETLPGFVSQSLLTFWAPGKTPEAIVRRLNQETVKALGRPETQERLLKTGQEQAGGAPELLADAVRSEIARVAKLLQDLGIKPGG